MDTFQPTLKDAFEFLQRGRLFKLWEDSQKLQALCDHASRGELFWHHDNQKITGILLAKIDHEAKTVHVVGVEGRLKPFISFYKRYFTAYKLTGLRTNKLIEYNLCKNS